jgi:leucyl-tRNA synthetase
MSKSRGNVVNPDEVVKEYGADAMRLFEMFMGPLEEMKPWSTRGVEGVYRFLNRVWRLYVTEEGTLNPSFNEEEAPVEFRRLFHQTVKKVGSDIEGLCFNTAISQMMIFVNEAMKLPALPRSIMNDFVVLLSPFAPHLAEELWEKLGNPPSLFTNAKWIAYDPALLVEDEVTIIAQVNGKIRARFNAPRDLPEVRMKELALAEPNMKAHLEGKQVVKVIVVVNKLVNIVIR